MFPSQIIITLVGNEQVGKTSLISTFTNSEFCENVPSTLSDQTFSTELLPENVSLRLVDTNKNNPESLLNKLEGCDLVCVLYEIGSSKSLQSIVEFWLPFLEENGYTQPVIIVGTKNDIVHEKEDYETQNKMNKILMGLSLNFNRIELCTKCSAKNPQSVFNFFLTAQEIALYPLNPLYNVSTQELNPNFHQALLEIFKICDQDNDNLLNEKDFDYLEFKVFNSKLEKIGYPTIVKTISDGTFSGIQSNSITVEGWIYLCKYFISNGSRRIIWKIIRTFGYNNEFIKIKNVSIPEIKVKPEESIEFTDEVIQFLEEKFNEYDQSQEGFLTKNFFEKIFFYEGGFPYVENWMNCIETEKNNRITLNGFISIFQLKLISDTNNILKTLVRLGYPNEISKMFKIQRDKLIDFEQKTCNRNVFVAYVFGSKGSGKSTLLRSLINEEFFPIYLSTTKTQIVANQITNPKSENEKKNTLILVEYINETNIINSSRILNCDVAIFLYDRGNVDSLKYIQNIFNKMKISIPVVLIENKIDLPKIDYKLKSKDMQNFLKAFNLKKPLELSLKDYSDESLFFQEIIKRAKTPWDYMLKPKIQPLKYIIPISTAVTIGSILYFYLNKKKKNKDN
ncbi:rho gtpase 2 [Anaeramoeba flamelloides]|uniref:Mitochondrial Rho GTPase n=1 Tax=Anaeramoeba flamelloides TaxID=1746091 RepID=A0ABQ8X4P2_9EUKA|nr:rho gtpase 2 [Anaeramoeba flamelloides]